MANFSSSDINDAKRRVEEMRKKSKDYISQEPETKQEKALNSKQSNPITDILGSLITGSSTDNSKGLILALILILSREGADNILIMALIYILL